ncbi:MAG TPA: DNA polymerase III subunit delta' [Mycobacteriales bacterium]|nr:DNA polymerase III subunit delta' [Mycobacteriales bacterium]
MSVFDVLVGQEVATSRLRAAVAGDGMTHAWLFTGPPGSGRSVAARAFAAALQCPAGGCGSCDSCRQVAARSAPDVTLIRPEGVAILKGDAELIIGRMARRPQSSPWTVVVVEDADRLTDIAANMLLKTLEEPPPQAVLLLCAPSTEDILATIRSRCRSVVLALPSTADITAVLTAEGVPEDRARWAAGAAQGHVGRARALATDESAREQRQRALAIAGRLSSVGECLEASADLVTAATAEAKVRTAAAVEEADALLEAVGKVRGSAGLRKEVENRIKSQTKRSRRDALDRALVDLAAWYRDVTVTQLGGTTLVHADQADAIRSAAATSSAEVNLRRVEAILACREVLTETNVDELLAVERMALALRSA